MSWASWGSRLNVTSIVSQGLEQVNKLKEDVEKQFDQVVTGAPTATIATARTTTSSGDVSSSSLLFGALTTNGEHSDSTMRAHPIEPSVVASSAMAPPRSNDGKQSDPAASLAPWAVATPLASTSSSSTTTTTKRMNENVDFFGSFLPEKTTSTLPTAPTDAPPRPSSVAEMSTTAAVDTTTVDHEEKDDELEEKAPALDDDAANETKSVVEPTAQEHVGLGEEEEEHQDGVPIEDSDECGAGPPEQRDDEDRKADDTERDRVEEEVPVDAAHVPVVDEPPPDQADTVRNPDPQPDVHSDHNVDEETIPEAEDFKTPSIHGGDDVATLKQQLEQREAQLMSTSAVIRELHDELDKTCQREVTAVERNRFLTEQLELMRQEVIKLHNRLTASQQTPRHDADLVALQQAVAEKDEKLKALLEEGQALSVKQSQLEQRLRQLRKEKNDEEEKKLKLGAQCDILGNQVQELTISAKALEDENKRLQSEIKQLRGTTEQTNKKLATTEQELSAARDRVVEMETRVAALNEENGRLRDEIDHLAQRSESHDSLSAERSEMEATIHFLQQNVHDLEAESARREDAMRLEIVDLKRKWKDALQRVDVLGQSVSDATQPLLRQINALQDEQRGRQETWKATEATLLERIESASQLRKAIEQEKLHIEQALHDTRVQMEDLQLEVTRKKAEILRERERFEAMQQREREARSRQDALQIELDELKHRLDEAQHTKQTLLARAAHEQKDQATSSQQQADNAAALTAELEALRCREEKLQHDLQWHQKELQRVKLGATSSPRPLPSPLLHRRSFDDDRVGSPRESGDSQASILQRTLETNSDDTRLGSTSVLGMSQLQQRLRLREGENRMLRQQLQAIEDKHKQTSEEIVRLSTRNALLEASATQFQATQDELGELRAKQHVLLELFGEKEEQVEELQAEVTELKAFYRKQLDTLARQQ